MFEIVKKLYQHRVLIYMLVVREVKARYRESVMGVFWTLLNPLLLMLVYYTIFSFVMKVNMEGYLVYMFVGLLPWMWFASSISDGTTSIIMGGDMVKKTIFPSEILPVVYVMSNMINFFLSLPVLFLFLFLFGVKLGFSIIYFPLIVLIQLMFTLGIVFFLSVLNVWFRDVQQLVANLTNLWFYVTPVIYPMSQVPGWAKKFFYLNPMYSFIVSYQNVLFFNKPPEFLNLFVIFMLSSALFLKGQSFFKQHQDYFPEEI